jgi:putative serine protease PepD
MSAPQPSSTGSQFQAPPPSAPGAAFGPAAAASALAVGALIGGTAGAGAAVLAISAYGSPSVEQTGAISPQTITINDTDDVDIISAVASKATPSVVTISVRSDVGGGTGSGVVIDDRGHIVTNTHVVTLDGAASDPTITVTTSDGRVLPATIVGTDPIMDLAVIAVDPAADLPAVELADSGDLNVGDQTIAIGAPLGLAGTVTSGIVSALNRSITVASSAVPEGQSSTEPEEESDGDSSDPFDFFNFDIPGQTSTKTATSTIQLAVIQTDTAINPGNSGGALLDDQGRLIGINVAIASASSSSSGDIGIGFAIPSNVVKRVAGELIANGSASHGLLGASVANVTEDPAQTDAGVVGASIVELVAGGAAETAGLQVGDIVVDFDGSPITSKNDLTAQVRTHAAGASASVTVVRDGESKTVEVTLGSL